MQKDVYITATVDRMTAAALHELAVRDHEGNRSAAVRRLIREGALAHGVQLAERLQVQTQDEKQERAECAA